MHRHHDSWYEFATNHETYGLACKPEDIILVRGTVKTTAWALAAYLENGNHTHEVVFDGQAPFASAGFKWSTSRQSSAKFECRLGPNDDISLRRIHPGRLSIASGKAAAGSYEDELPEILVQQQRGRDVSIDADNLDNQCVFLGYYRIKYRIFKFKKIDAAAGPHELPPAEDPDLASAVVTVDSESDIEVVPAPSKVRIRRRHRVA